MPTRPRNARKSKNAHAKLSSGPSSADASASQTPLSPPVQLPTPLPEPQERIRATLARVEGVEAGRGEGGETERGEAEAHDERREYAEEFGYLQRGGGGPQDEEEEFVPPPPQVEVDEDGDVLGQLIDFGSLPSSPPSMPPPRLPADPHFDQVPVSQHGQQQEGHDVSLSGFLNDTHRREEDTNPFGVSAATYEEEPRETPFDSQTAYPYPRALLGGEAASEGSQPGLDGGEDEAEGGEEAEEAEEEEGERVVYKSPPFMQVGLPEVEEDAVVPGREAETAEKEEGGLGLGIPGRTGREGGMGHVRAPTVVVNSRSSSSSASSSHVRSLSSASTTSSSINPPSLTLDLSTSSSGSAFGSLSKTIRSYAPSLPMGITSPGGKGSRKSAPYPPLVSRPVVAGRVESGYGGGTMKSPYEQEFEREYERDWEDEGRVGEPFNYGYSKSPPATVEAFLPPLSRTPVTPTSRAATPSRVATSTSTSTAALRTASTGYSRAPSATTSRPASASRTTTTVPVPDRQRAWPEYASSSSPAQGPPSTVVSRHRATRSQGSQATLASGLASGLTQTLRGGVDAVSSRSSTPSTLMGTSAQARVEGEGDDVIERVVWARWDTLEKRQVLVVGYERGVQVWDAGRLGSVAEVLNVNFGKAKDGWVDGKKGEKVKSVVKGMVVPGSTELVILLETRSSSGIVGSTAVLYSMREDRVVSRWRGEGLPIDVECGRGVVVVSTSSPPALHILSPTLGLLHTIPSSSLALFSTPRVTSSNSQLSLAIPSSISPSNTFASAHPPHGDVIERREIASAAHRAELPHPVYAVHGRLLAYAIPSSSSSTSLRRKDSSLSSSSGGSGPSPSSITSGSPLASALTGLSGGQGLGLGSGIAGIPNTKAELGSAALKVGSGLIGGMRFLGGMALEGVKSRMSASPSPSASQRSGASSLPGNPASMFSRSAPTNDSVVLTADEEKKRRRFSDIQHHGVLAPFTSSRNPTSQGFTIRVVDLSSLSASSAALDATIRDAADDEGMKLRVVAEFVGSRSQPIAKLDFTPDGCGVYVVPRDGLVTKVFHLLPVPPSPSASTINVPSTTSTSGNDVKTGSVLPLYEFRRGRVKAAVVESVKGVPDGRWAGVVTRNRTVHVFAPNPLGGKAHISSHLDGRMRQGAPIVPTTARTAQNEPKAVELKPIVRLSGERLAHGEQGWSAENPPPAMAFTFVDQSTSLPPPLAPMPASHHHHRPSTSASSNAASSPPAGLSLSASPGSPLSPRATKAPKNYQDALLFDSATGMLYLQRITVESKLKSDSFVSGLGGGAVSGLVNAAINVSSSLGSKSISAASLPGGGAGPIAMTSNASVASSSVSSHSGAAVPRAYGKQVGGGGDEGYELVGHANVVAHWDLRKRRGWEEIRGKVGSGGERERVGGGGSVGPDECLAQAELSTFSKSRSQRSRPIYLTHQFAFHTLGEDYHALIRKYRLDVHGSKIDVRRDIPIHAFGASTQGGPSSESFVEGFSPTRSSHPSHLGGGVPSSFDEPLASALAGEMEYAPSSNVLPMYPNGPGGGMGGTGRSLRNSIPIRKIGDGVSGGLGRIRRAVPSAVRSPRLGPSRSGGSGVDDVSDVLLEFDEEVDDFMAPRIVAPGQGGVGVSPGMDDDVVGTVDEEIWGDNGWDSQDRMAIEEEEQFHAISGTLSPQFEQEVMLPPPTGTSSTPSAGAAKAKKSKKTRK